MTECVGQRLARAEMNNSSFSKSRQIDSCVLMSITCGYGCGCACAALIWLTGQHLRLGKHFLGFAYFVPFIAQFFIVGDICPIFFSITFRKHFKWPRMAQKVVVFIILLQLVTIDHLSVVFGKVSWRLPLNFFWISWLFNVLHFFLELLTLV